MADRVSEIQKLTAAIVALVGADHVALVPDAGGNHALAVEAQPLCRKCSNSSGSNRIAVLSASAAPQRSSRSGSVSSSDRSQTTRRG